MKEAETVVQDPERLKTLWRRWIFFFTYLLLFPMLLQLLFGAADFSGGAWLIWSITLLIRSIPGIILWKIYPLIAKIPGGILWPLLFAISIFTAVINTTDLYLLINFAALLDWQIFHLMLASPLRETAGFFQLFLLRWYNLPLILLYPAIGILIFYPQKKRIAAAGTGIITIIAISLFYFQFTGKTFRSPRHPAERIWDFTAGLLSSRTKLDLDAANRELKAENAEKEAVYLLVIGESHSKARSQLYGFPRATMPECQKLFDAGKLKIFDGVFSPHAMTHLALPKLLSLECHGESGSFRERPNIIDIFRKAGFKSWYVYNQIPVSEKRLPYLAIAKRADKFLPLSSSAAQLMDERFITLLPEILADPCPKKLLIFHLRGSHWKYDKNFPPEYSCFKGDEKFFTSGQRKNIHWVNAYDSSLRYTDHILSSLISILEKQHENAFMLYLPDHGEALWEKDNIFGHTELLKTPETLEIPMLLWCSEKYLQKSPDDLRKLLSDDMVKCSWNSQDLPYMMMMLGRIKTPLSQSGRTPFASLAESDKYQP